MPTTEQLLTCCINTTNGLGGVADELNNTCTATLSNYGLSEFSMDDACYWYNQQAASQVTTQNAFNPDSWGNFLAGAGSFLGSIFGLVGAQAPPGGGAVTPPTPADEDKKKNTLIALGAITLLVVGVAIYYIIKKRKK